MTASLFLSLSTALLLFRGTVPPHAAADGVRYQLVASKSVNVREKMRDCGIEDFEEMGAPNGEQAFKFAVTRSTEAHTLCLRAALADAARFEPRDNWISDAKTD